MRAVMISIRPEWCEKIMNGKKTVEVRKTRPKLETPFKCYIYCTAGIGKNTLNVPISNKRIVEHYVETGSMVSLNCPIGNSKVIGEFICDYILPCDSMILSDFERESCMKYIEYRRYAGDKCGYRWHISNLVIYDTPKNLCEFTGIKSVPRELDVPFLIKRPPQSWCHVLEWD